MKALCSGCRKPLRKLDDATVHGYDHRTNEDVFTCRSCHMLAGAKANLELAQLALVRLRAERATPLVNA